jgi:arsenate reductase-like glutaredoxin family protein
MEPMPELKITLYTTEDCNKCRLLKMLLATKHVDFRDLDAVANREQIKDL